MSMLCCWLSESHLRHPEWLLKASWRWEVQKETRVQRQWRESEYEQTCPEELDCRQEKLK